MNHGCNGSFNVDALGLDGATEQNFDTFNYTASGKSLYNPFLDRHRHSVEDTYDYALSDIKAGEELLCNYLFFTDVANEELWVKEAHKLRRICNGEEVGDITIFEEENQAEQ